jgi:hypothetical protein
MRALRTRTRLGRCPHNDYLDPLLISVAWDNFSYAVHAARTVQE